MWVSRLEQISDWQVKRVYEWVEEKPKITYIPYTNYRCMADVLEQENRAKTIKERDEERRKERLKKLEEEPELSEDDIEKIRLVIIWLIVNLILGLIGILEFIILG